MAKKITDTERLQAASAIITLEGVLARLKPGAPQRKGLLEQIAENQKILDAWEAQKAAEKTGKADDKIKRKIADLKNEREILVAKKKDTTDVDAQLKELRGQLSTAVETPKDETGKDEKVTYKGDGTTDKPLTADGKPFTGTKDSKQYKDGVIVTPAPTKPAPTKPTPTVPTPVDDTKTAYISALREVIKSLPKADNLEVTKLLDQAAKSGMQETAFMTELAKTNWWQSSLPSLQAYFIESHDPRNAGTFAQKLQTQTDAISAKLESLGITATQVDPITGKFYDNTKVIQGIASMAMMNGWNDNQLNQHLAETAQLHFTGGGTIGSTVDNIKLNAMKYGITIDDNYLNQIQFSLLDPNDGRDSQYYINEMKNQAMDLYKPFADQVAKGRTLYEVTNNYRTKMATLLETNEANVSWKDLMGKVIDPLTGNARMESDFIKQVKKDPLWQYTKNAKETYSNTALDLMKQFGFMG